MENERVLTEQDWPAVEALIKEVPTYEGLLRSPYMTKLIVSKIRSKFFWLEQIVSFGSFEDEQLVAFLQIIKWPNSETDYSLCNDYLKPGFENRQLLTSLLNFAIETIEADGKRNSVWVSCPYPEDAVPPHLRWKIVKQSVLGKREIKIVDEVEPGEIPAKTYWIWQPSTKLKRQFVNIKKHAPAPADS